MNEPSPFLNRLAIVGVGLIGGSLALAAKSRGIVREVVGIGRRADRLEAARQAGVIDTVLTDPAGLKQADLVVVCTPPGRIAADVLQILEQTTSETIVTDGGSVKREIVQAIEASPQRARFVGAHPLAGSHQAGFEHAQADLFQDRLCVLTPTESTSPAAKALVRSFWEQVGMRVQELAPDEHDRLLAATSHLPHLTASALASQVGKEHLDFAATGFRDTTRIAAGDPELWTSIFSLNADHLADLTEQLMQTLSEFRDALLCRDEDKLRTLLTRGQTQRNLFFRDQDSPPKE